VQALLSQDFGARPGEHQTRLGAFNRFLQQNGWQMIVVGVIGLFSGVLAFLWRSIPAQALSTFIGAWAIARGVTEILAAQELHGVVDDAWLLIIAGFCSALFGVALIAQVRADVLAKL
jgi:uncharacterized membrane protein HdeD (DUF308 family)